MKIGIITHYDVHNHGAILQLNALIKVLKQVEYEAFALQFEKNYDFLGIELKDKYNISMRSIPFYIKYLLQQGFCQTIFNIKKKRLLDAFKKRNALVGNYYTTYKDLKAIIIGSDEVFALHTGPTPAFWGYSLPSKNIFAYAGCFGPTTINSIKEKYCETFVKAGLESMNNLSVRDYNSYTIIKQLLGKEVPIVCDPVILYGYEHELKTMSKIPLKPYLLVYAYDNNMNTEQEVHLIKEYAHKRGLQIVSPGFYHKWCDKNINVDPVSLLAYFRDANCVITDTFHGSVMSIITNTEFAVHIRGNSNKLENLLQEYHLEKRIASTTNNYEFIFNQPINWDDVNESIQDRREFSKQYLMDNLIK